MCNQTYKYTVQRQLTGMQEEQTAVISVEEVAGGNYVACVEVEEGWYVTTPSSNPDEAREKGEDLAEQCYCSD